MRHGWTCGRRASGAVRRGTHSRAGDARRRGGDYAACAPSHGGWTAPAGCGRFQLGAERTNHEAARGARRDWPWIGQPSVRKASVGCGVTAAARGVGGTGPRPTRRHGREPGSAVISATHGGPWAARHAPAAVDLSPPRYVGEGPSERRGTGRNNGMPDDWSTWTTRWIRIRSRNGASAPDQPDVHAPTPNCSSEFPTVGGAVPSLRAGAPAGEGTLHQQSLARKTRSTRFESLDPRT